MSPSQPLTMIIGAGLGGLTLAQSLRNQQLPYKIFERDEGPEVRKQGWCISLDEALIEKFKSSFSDDMPDLKGFNHLGEMGGEMEMAVYAGSKEVMRKEGGGVRVERKRLRKWLMTGLDIEWGKKFLSYREENDGIVAVFEDGEEVRGDVLVGADGVGSRVRKQFLPGIEPERVSLRLVVGELTVPEEVYKSWMQLGRSFFTSFDGERRITVALKKLLEGGREAEYYWLFGLQGSPGEEWKSREEMYSFVMGNLDGLDERVREVLKRTGLEGMVWPGIVVRDMLPPDENMWPKGRVTLMGDAVHAMTPFRGQGGNMAMADGLSLGYVLGKKTEGIELEGLLREYEEEMRPRATKWVLASRDAVKKQEKWS